MDEVNGKKALSTAPLGWGCKTPNTKENQGCWPLATSTDSGTF